MLVSALSGGDTVETTTWVLPSRESHSRGACTPAVPGGGGQCHRRVRTGTEEVGRRGTWPRCVGQDQGRLPGGSESILKQIIAIAATITTSLSASPASPSLSITVTMVAGIPPVCPALCSLHMLSHFVPNIMLKSYYSHLRGEENETHAS